jgi:signal transduction histidine kinase
MTVMQGSFVRRIFLPMLAGVVALFAIVGMSLWLTNRTTQDTDQVVRERHLHELSSTLLDHLQNMETGHRGYLLTRDLKFLEPYTAARPMVDEIVKRLKEAVAADPRASALIDQVSARVDDKLRAMIATLDLASAGTYDPVRDIADLDRGKLAMDDIRRLLSGFIIDSNDRIAARLSDMQANSRLLTWISVSASLLIVLVTGAAIWTATQYMRELLEAHHAVEAANASLEGRVKERTVDLTRANEEIQRYAYIVTHDLRAPLVNIVGFTSELESGLKTIQSYAGDGGGAEVQAAVKEEMPEAIGFIRASTTKMDKLINAILKLSREGRRQLHPERVDLKALVDGTVASVQHQLEEKNVEIEVSNNLPTISSDRLALEQIFGNLIDNAVKYLSPGRSGKIEVTVIDFPTVVLIEVVDNGRGIAREDQERIFELFRRSGGQTVAGEGIGLAHVRALVGRLGGEITVESEIGRGSKFKVRLPKYLSAAADLKDA